MHTATLLLQTPLSCLHYAGKEHIHCLLLSLIQREAAHSQCANSMQIFPCTSRTCRAAHNCFGSSANCAHLGANVLPVELAHPVNVTWWVLYCLLIQGMPVWLCSACDTAAHSLLLEWPVQHIALSVNTLQIGRPSSATTLDKASGKAHQRLCAFVTLLPADGCHWAAIAGCTSHTCPKLAAASLGVACLAHFA
jgi:hypothetical protein